MCDGWPPLLWMPSAGFCNMASCLKPAGTEIPKGLIDPHVCVLLVAVVVSCCVPAPAILGDALLAMREGVIHSYDVSHTKFYFYHFFGKIHSSILLRDNDK